MADRNSLQTTQTKLSLEIFPGRQCKCNRNTDMGQLDRKPLDKCNKVKAQTQLVILKHGLDYQTAFNELYQYLQISE